MGIGAAEDLKENEMYLEIPEVLTFNRAKILKSPIGFIIENHPEVFDKSQEVDFSLIVFIMYEKLKGQDSFWAPYFNIVNPSDLPAFWSDEEILEF